MMRLCRDVFLAAMVVVTPTLWAIPSSAVNPSNENSYSFAQVGQDLAVGNAAVERIVASNGAHETLSPRENENTSEFTTTKVSLNFDTTPTIPNSILRADLKNEQLVKTLTEVANLISFTPAAPSFFDTSVLRVMTPTTRVQPFAAVAMTRDPKSIDESRMGFGAGTRVNFTKQTNLGTEVLVFPVDGLSGFDSLGKIGDVRMITRLEIKF